jgi:polysaccharide deacetylase 2 family uncharacterized protein YibQ
MAGLHERDALNEPLGLAQAPSRQPVPYKRLVLGGCGLAIAGLLIYFVETDDRKGGEPFAVATIAQPAPAPGPAVAMSDRPAADSANGRLTAGDAEALSGVKVVRGGGAPPPASVIIEVPQAVGVHLDPAPDPRLVEKSRFGLLPRIGVDGARPAEVYARPQLIPSKLKGAPRIALIVGGLGLSDEGTANAIAQLPGAVSLGFAPYGARLDEQAAAARDAGHETLLQLPMEPFDYASDNPGPHTLLTSASDAQNLDDLHWLMGRFQGYAGVTNFLGAKFTADQAALSPVLRDVAARGLLYVDDGASPRSLARGEAAKVKLPAAIADIVIDATPKPDAIDDALNRLEALARANGSALGVATALPVSVDHVARWARGLEARGLALTPVSAIVTRGPGPAAQASP